MSTKSPEREEHRREGKKRSESSRGKNFTVEWGILKSKKSNKKPGISNSPLCRALIGKPLYNQASWGKGKKPEAAQGRS